MAGSLDVMIKFLTDTSGVKNAVDDVEGTGSKIKDWAGKAALAVGGAFAVDKIVEFGKASVEAAAEDARSQAVLADTMRNSTGASDAQIKSMEKEISAFSKGAAVADDELRPAMGNLLRATGDTSKSLDLMQTALDASAATGKDLGSVTLAMGKAAQGSTAGLAKLGIETKNAKGEALTADQVFLNMANTFRNQSSDAANTAAGKMAGAKIQMQEFQEQIGGYVLPILAKLADFFTNTLLPAISGFVDWLSAHKDVVVAALIGFGVVVGAVVVPAFISWAIAAGAAAIATLAAAAPFIAIGAVIAAVAFVIIKNWDTIKSTAETAWNFVLGIIKGVWQWVAQNWPFLLAILLGPFGLAVGLIIKNFDTIKAGAQAAIDWITGAWGTLVGFFTGLPGKIANAVSGMWNSILDGFRSVINGVIDLWNKLHFTLPKIDLGPLGSIGGGTIGVPTIPHLAQGGLMTGDGLVYAHAGEVISPAPAGVGGPAIHIENAHFSDGADIELLMRKATFLSQAATL